MIPLEIFWILWMFILPILGISLAVAAPLFWFIIVPSIARRLTWERFRKLNYFLVADDAGYLSLLSTTERIPEGVERTKKGWQFLPRPRYKKLGNPGKSKKEQKKAAVERLALKKYTWRDVGKPTWLGYAGKVSVMNPATLAGLEQSEDNSSTLGGWFEKAQKFMSSHKMPPKFRKSLTKLVDDAKKTTKATKVTLIDPAVIKEVLPRMYTPSQLKALATNREQYGMEKRGHEYGRLILGMGFILGMVLIIILAMSMLMK